MTGDPKMTEAAAAPSLSSLFKKKGKKAGKAMNFNTDAKTIKQKEEEAAKKKKESEMKQQLKEDEKKWAGEEKIETKQLRVGMELGQVEKEEEEEATGPTMGWNKAPKGDAKSTEKAGQNRMFPQLSGESRMVILHSEQQGSKIKTTRNRFANFGESDDEDAGPVMTRKKQGEMIKRSDDSPEADAPLNPKEAKAQAVKAEAARLKKEEAAAKKAEALARMEAAAAAPKVETPKVEPVRPKCDIKPDLEAIMAKFEDRRKLDPKELPDSEMY